MTGALAAMAAGAGLRPEPGPPAELRARCDGPTFHAAVGRLAQTGILADLFATTRPDQPARLTAVLHTAHDPRWLVVETELAGRDFPSLTPTVHAASWYEREIQEMHGLEAEGHPAPAPLRLHDWPADRPPMGARPTPPGAVPHVPRWEAPPTVEGQGVFQLPLGPVRSGPQESARFLFSSGGEDLVAVTPRLGYKFRAVERMAEGLPADRALLLAERVAGTSAFANALAFARAAERALGLAVAPQAERARTALAELERLRHHTHALGRLAEATGLGVAAAQYALLTEESLRLAAELTGHRYLRGSLVLGGCRAGLDGPAWGRLGQRATAWARRASRIRSILDATATFRDRLDTTAILEPAAAAAHHLVGPVARASGLDRDCRRDHPFAAYAAVAFPVPTAGTGDAAARATILLDEMDQALAILDQLAAGAVPPAPWDPGRGRGAALGWAEAPAGEALHALELDLDGRVVRWRARPPAVVNWHPFAQACASGNNLTDYPVIEASFALAPAEFDR